MLYFILYFYQFLSIVEEMNFKMNFYVKKKKRKKIIETDK